MNDGLPAPKTIRIGHRLVFFSKLLELLSRDSPINAINKPKADRLSSLDAFRGMCIGVMIFVNYGGIFWLYDYLPFIIHIISIDSLPPSSFFLPSSLLFHRWLLLVLQPLHLERSHLCRSRLPVVHLHHGRCYASLFPR